MVLILLNILLWIRRLLEHTTALCMRHIGGRIEQLVVRFRGIPVVKHIEGGRCSRGLGLNVCQILMLFVLLVLNVYSRVGLVRAKEQVLGLEQGLKSLL